MLAIVTAVRWKIVLYIDRNRSDKYLIFDMLSRNCDSLMDFPYLLLSEAYTSFQGRI